ncbi:MAG: leucine-rich repeat protein [Clostridia bacterium]|nr:leucine-rich repeat protein [Clostridia bacterium]
MKRKVLSIITFVIFSILTIQCYFPIIASANQGCLTFALNPNGKTYYVKDCDFTYTGDIIIPSTYRNKPVTTIGMYAFEYCDSFNSLTIPTSIKYIGDSAFSRAYAYAPIYYQGNADQWASIHFNNDESSPLRWPNYLYLNGKKVVNLVFSDSLKEIKSYAFTRCITLKSVKLGKNIEKIGGAAFARNDITSINLPDGLKEIGGGCFSETSLKQIIIPHSVTSIGGGAFSYCNDLTYVRLPNGITKIEMNTFNGCKKLTSIKIPKLVTKIDENAFSGCSLQSINFPKALKHFYFGNYSKSIYFPGNKSEYSNINILEPFYLQNSPVYYNVPIINNIENIYKGVKIEWNEVTDATDYRVYRKGAGEKNWLYLATTKDTQYIDKNVKGNNYYRYTLRATNSTGLYSNYYPDSEYIKYVDAPNLSSITNAKSGIYIDWKKVDNATSYNIYRRGAGQTTWTKLGSTTNLWYVDNTVINANGNYYRYSVSANTGFNSGFDTNGLTIKRLANPQLLTAVSSTSGITVKWSQINGTTGYYVYRKTANTNWSRVAAVGGTNNTTYIDKGTTKGVTYTYTVRACYGYTLSSYDSGITCTDKH